ncbi:MAG: hypothetical protein KDA91_02895 [Planctomycetaceae bacterium]|nr:hypothetical protein [Planctomycetaceae bacterium]
MRILLLLVAVLCPPVACGQLKDGRYLYVASPGIRNYPEYGGHGILVFDIDNDHAFVKRIPTSGLDASGKPINVKGICASSVTDRIYVSTLTSLSCLDLTTEKLLWEKFYDGGCDRMSLTPDGHILYVPSLEKGHWHVVNAADGSLINRIQTNSGAHNTICGPSGRFAYLAGLKSPVLTIVETQGHSVFKTCGPFSHNIRPFTINGSESLVFVCINDCLGFEIGDLETGKRIHRVEVNGFSMGPVKRHGCPSHGIGLTPDEKQLWVTDGHNSHLHVYDATVMPPVQMKSFPVRDQPGWVTFSIDGRFAYPSSGEVFETVTFNQVALLTDEVGRDVGSEKMLEIDWKDGEPVAHGDQFGIGHSEQSNSR